MSSLFKLSTRELFLVVAVVAQGAVIIYQQRQLHFSSRLPIQPHVRQQILERGENERSDLKQIYDSGPQPNPAIRQ